MGLRHARSEKIDSHTQLWAKRAIENEAALGHEFISVLSQGIIRGHNGRELLT